MRRALLAAAVLVTATQVGAVQPVSSLTPIAVDLSFGKVLPDGVSVARPASVLIRTPESWVLTATLDSRAPALDMRRDEIELRVGDATWVRLIEGLPVRVAAGEGTTDAGVVVHAEVRVKPSAESQPGRRKATLQFSIGGAQRSTAIPISYEIERWSRLEADPRPFDSPAINPARAGLYPYDRRLYLARSNVPWVVELVITEFKSKGNTAILPPDTIVLLRDGRDPQPIAAGQPVIVGRGAPTATGAVIDLQLAIRIDNEALVGGEYAADLNVVIRPDADAAETSQMR